MGNSENKQKKIGKWIRYITGTSATLAHLISRYAERGKIPSRLDLLIALGIIGVTVFLGTPLVKKIYTKIGELLEKEWEEFYNKKIYSKDWNTTEFIKWMTECKLNPEIKCDDDKNERKWRKFQRSKDKSLCQREFCRLGPKGIIPLPKGIIKRLPRHSTEILELDCKIRGIAFWFKVRLLGWSIKNVFLDTEISSLPKNITPSLLLFKMHRKLPRYRTLPISIKVKKHEGGVIYLIGRFQYSFEPYLFNNIKDQFSHNICWAFEEERRTPPNCIKYNTEIMPEEEIARLQKLGIL